MRFKPIPLILIKMFNFTGRPTSGRLFIALFSSTLLATLCFGTRAEAIEISVVSGINFAAPSYSSHAVVQPTTGTGSFEIGALSAIPIRYGFEFETGLLYQNVDYSSSNGTILSEISFSELQVPFLVRYKIDEKIGIGLGTFWDIGLGGVSSKNSAGQNTNTFSDLNLFSNDFGLLFNVHALIPLNEWLAVVIDGRYLLGLEERAKDVSLASYKTRSIQGLLGMALFF